MNLKLVTYFVIYTLLLRWSEYLLVEGIHQIDQDAVMSIDPQGPNS